MAEDEQERFDDDVISDLNDDYTRRKKIAAEDSLDPNTIVFVKDKYITLTDWFSQRLDDNILLKSDVSFLLENYPYLYNIDIYMSYVDAITVEVLSRNPELISELYDFSGSQTFSSLEEINKYYLRWLEQKEQRIQNAKIYSSVIDLVHDAIDRVIEDNFNKLVTSEFNYTNLSVVIAPDFKSDLVLAGREITVGDGLGIFNDIVTNERIPFVKYIDNSGESYYKVFTGDTIENTPDYEKITSYDNRNDRVNFIYMILWNEASTKLSKTSTKYLNLVAYDLDKNRISFNTAIGNEFISIQEIREILNNTLTSLNLEFEVKSDIKGRFNLFAMKEGNGNELEEISGYILDPDVDVNINQLTFLDFVNQGLVIDTDLDQYMNEKNEIENEYPADYIAGHYFYLDEANGSIASKNYIRLKYRSLTSETDIGSYLQKDVPVSMLQKISFEIINRSTTEVEYQTIEEKLIRIAQGTKYLEIVIWSASSEEDLLVFIEVLKASLLSYYNIEEDIDDEYVDFLTEDVFEESTELERNVRLISKEISSSERKCNTLRKLDPEIFMSGYSRNICRNCPVVISEEEIEDYRRRYITVYENDQPVQKERQILSFPKESKKYHFVCTDNKFPYIGLRRNKKLANRKEYPYLPCCYPVDQQNNPKPTGYKEYMTGQKHVRTGKTADTKGRQAVPPNSRGKLPPKIESILKMYDRSNTDPFARRGVFDSPGSLIHCIALAADPDYLSILNDEEALVDYELNKRNELATLISLHVYRQEIYDRNIEQIREALLDESVYLDPRLFFRGLEELYGVNIFSFVPIGKKDDDIQIPRSWLFSIRPYRTGRPTVMIYNNTSSDEEAIDYPRCELIIQKHSEQESALFPQSMYDICYRVLFDRIQTLTWSQDYDGKITGHVNLYSNTNFFQLFGTAPYEQYIDSNGKCRAFSFKIADDNQVETDISVILPPTAPESISVTSAENLFRVDLSLARELFGNESTYDINSYDLIVGVWFSLYEVEQAIYVPINEIESDQYFNQPGPSSRVKPEQGEHNPLISSALDSSQRYLKLKKTLSVFLGIVKWLYEIHRYSTVEKFKSDIDQHRAFFSYLSVTDYDGDSLDYYNFFNISYSLPRYDNLKDAFAFLRERSINLVGKKTDEIICYNDEFSEKIVKFLNSYYLRTEGLVGNIPSYINNYFITVNDFNQIDNTLLFISKKSFNRWISRMKVGQFNVFVVNDLLSLDNVFYRNPYLFRIENNYYIVQNVASGFSDVAYKVARNWKKYRINLGYETTDDIDTIPDEARKLYGINDSGTLTLLEEENINDQEKALEIVRYGDSTSSYTRYAALLPLN